MVVVAPGHARAGSNDTVTHTLSSGDINLAIPDNSLSGATSTLNESVVGTVVDLTVSLRITHPNDGDLQINLANDDGRAVAIVNQEGGTGDNFGDGATTCAGNLTVLDDLAAVEIVDATPPYAGTFQPEGALSNFVSGNLAPDTAEGTWSLDVFDKTASNTGTLHCFKLEITIDTDSDDDSVPDATDNCRRLGNDGRCVRRR
jgi:subtilisin-like proprotein convertase family protein